MAIFKTQLWRILWLLICVMLAACGGGGGGASFDPVDPTEVNESNYESYLDVARLAWGNYGGGGLNAVIAALEGETNNMRYEYDQVVEFVKSLPEYQRVLASHNVWWDNNRPAADFDHPFTLTMVHKAHAAGLTGKGQLVAVYDDGFDIYHPDLIGKEIDCGLEAGEHGGGDFGGCRLEFEEDQGDHGTATSVIAAGASNGEGLIGVAPGAKLLLLDWRIVSQIDAIDRALAAGAVSQNNSWGFGSSVPCDEGSWECDHNPIWFAPPPDHLAAAAYDRFQASGVIVFARSNDDRTPLTDEWWQNPSDFPYFFEDLQEAWISVGNVRIKTGENGNVEEVERDSSPCNLSAAWCLIGNGHLTHAVVTDPSDPNDNPYESWTGTSYFAPQVAGAVALLAEAFPNLSPADLTARLLASANNRWFLKDGDVGYNPLATLGERCWNVGEANEFCHDYSQEWGHGIMDLEAALTPVGDLFIVNGAQLQGASRATLSQANLSAPSNSFGSLIKALSVPLTTFDALNGNFAINAAGLVAEQETSPGAASLLRRFEREGLGAISEAPDRVGLNVTAGNYAYSMTYDVSAGGVPTEFEVQHQPNIFGIRVGFGFTSADKTASFGGLETIGYSINPTGFADLLGDVAYVTVATGVEAFAGLDGEPATFTLFTFTGENGADTSGSISGLGARFGLNIDNTRLEVSATFAAEDGSYLGISGHDDVWFGGTANLAATQIALRHGLGNGLGDGLGDGFFLTARAEIGTVSDGADDGRVSLISQMDQTLYTGFEIGLEQRGLFKDKDTFAVWASQPMRVEESGMTLTLPSGRTKDGTILYQDYSADLTPDTRQIDIGFSYRFPSDDGLSETQFGLMQSFNHGHVAGEHATSIAARHVMRF